MCHHDGDSVANLPDPHVAWLGEAAQLRQLAKSEPVDAEADRLAEMALRIEERVCETPARTLAGAMEQVGCAARFFGEYFETEPPEVVALQNALATLKRQSAGKA